MKGIFLCQFKDNMPDLPPMQSNDENHLVFKEDDGYSMGCPVPGANPTCLVHVVSSDAMILAMMADTERYPYSVEVK